MTVEDRVNRVRLSPDGLALGCTCPWWTQYRGTRGKCKHTPAAGAAHRNDHDDEEDL